MDAGSAIVFLKASEVTQLLRDDSLSAFMEGLYGALKQDPTEKGPGCELSRMFNGNGLLGGPANISHGKCTEGGCNEKGNKGTHR